MKKITKYFIAIVAVVLFASAQMNVKAQAFENGSMVGNAGLGFGWYDYGYGVTSFPAITVSLEKGIKELDFGTLAVGGVVGYKHATWASSYNYDWSWTDFVIAARGAVHVDLLKNEKVDTYGGLGLGLRFESWKYNDIYNNRNTETETHPLVAFYVGGRYYFTDKLAGFGELGYGLGYLTLGISYKFN
ncbi:MAG TPA: hypothetical protein VHO90_03420 [Bacteroidales bacterium]|nr:hypothetical protein [Bacteroidales bacterium]